MFEGFSQSAAQTPPVPHSRMSRTPVWDVNLYLQTVTVLGIAFVECSLVHMHVCFTTSSRFCTA